MGQNETMLNDWVNNNFVPNYSSIYVQLVDWEMDYIVTNQLMSKWGKLIIGQ
jgi:hypothetical protein